MFWWETEEEGRRVGLLFRREENESRPRERGDPTQGRVERTVASTSATEVDVSEPETTAARKTQEVWGKVDGPRTSRKV